jgi:hypothetical protein
MCKRYQDAKNISRSNYEEILDYDQELLSDFGLRLLYAETTVRAAIEKEIKGKTIEPWNVVELQEKTWDWIRPLLEELRSLRRERRTKTVREVLQKAAN